MGYKVIPGRKQKEMMIAKSDLTEAKKNKLDEHHVQQVTTAEKIDRQQYFTVEEQG